MNLSTDTVMAEIAKFELTIGGVKAWTPYWINQAAPPYWLAHPTEMTQEQIRVLRGKGSAEQIEAYANLALAQRGDLSDAPAVRAAMRELGLGIDCSAFVYWVMHNVLAAHGFQLADHLMMQAKDIRAALTNDPHRQLPPNTTAEAGGQLTAVCQLWQREPADYAGVQCLVDKRTSDPVNTTGAVLPGDLVQLSRVGNDHIGIVSAVTSKRITYYSSDSHQSDDPGGVVAHELSIENALLPLGSQPGDWGPYRFEGVWRPKVWGILG